MPVPNAKDVRTARLYGPSGQWQASDQKLKLGIWEIRQTSGLAGTTLLSLRLGRRRSPKGRDEEGGEANTVIRRAIVTN